VDVDNSHAVMASGCFETMGNTQSGLRFNICHLTSSFKLNSEVGNLASLIQEHIGKTLSYACCCWPAHIGALSEMDSGLIKGMEKLLSTQQLLYWLEVMSLTCTPPGPALAALYLQKDQLNPSLWSQFQEAERFISFNTESITQSVPHIYLSAVPFIPPLSLFRSASSMGVNTVSIRSGQILTWPSLKGDPLTGHNHWVDSVAFSPDGNLLASGSYDNTICLWDMHSQALKGEPLRRHSDHMQSVAFSPDGNLLAFGSYDNTICLWDVHTQTLKGEPLRGHTGSVLSVTFFPDGKTLASGSRDYTVCIWNLTT
ncbi:WD40 repeat-like protein, partial [Clavulina sp. PMI_390]